MIVSSPTKEECCIGMQVRDEKGNIAQVTELKEKGYRYQYPQPVSSRYGIMIKGGGSRYREIKHEVVS